MQRNSSLYTILFATAMCVVCGILVSSAAVSLLERQEFNAALDKRTKVLEAAGFIAPKEKVTAERVDELFQNIETVALDMATKAEAPDFDLEGYDQVKATGDPAKSLEAPANNAAIQRVPKYAQIFKVKDASGNVDMLVLPIEGLGLWGTLYGYIAVDPGDNQVRGITYYKHKETPGLGGEVDNPLWKGRWPDRKIYDDGAVGGAVALEVIKGSAGSVEETPYRVDGLSGATITGRGVTNMIHFWLGPEGFGQYIEAIASAKEA